MKNFLQPSYVQKLCRLTFIQVGETKKVLYRIKQTVKETLFKILCYDSFYGCLGLYLRTMHFHINSTICYHINLFSI